ncbi:phage tail protein [Salmonella enterica subsp. enterica]|nr:phage tail protein [Salmonella enterica subsp. enterica serovar Poona]
MLIGLYGKMPFVASSLVVNTFTAFKRKSSRRIAKHEVIGKKPVLEDIGPDLDSISFLMRLDTNLGVLPLVTLNALRAVHSAFESNPMVIGAQYFGNFVITDIDEGWKYFGPLGSPRVIEVALTMTEAGDNWLTDSIAEVKSNGLNGVGNVLRRL